ncbi:hypothetical protein GE09DRAFT_86962 [Coniochaeta sp. 2T2.1]|nr:hypothetical protein GE09DRAFT_86962 [Coniochaeta sp. 2T2.1]
MATTEVSAWVEGLQGLTLSSEAKILSNASQPEFQELLARWTDVDKKQPGAVVLPATEDDAVKIVKWAIENSVPFVPKAGGHSAWSTIGADGFILDFSLMRSVEVDVDQELATASAGTLIGDIAKAVAEKGYCVATGTVNSVGFIPSTIGGGLTVLAPLVGYGSDNIVSARMITAAGDVITVSEKENAELLYAAKGAGQFFGVILSLTVKMHPLSILGSSDGIVWSATLIFPTAKATEVGNAALELKKNSTRSYCLVGVLAQPPTFDAMIVAIIVYLGSKADAEKEFKGLLDVGPALVAADSEVPFGSMNDAYAAFEAKGGLKNWLAPGLTSIDQFKGEDMTYFVEQRGKIAEEFPLAKPTGFVIEFTSRGVFDKVTAERETAFSHRDVELYAHFLCWASEASALEGAVKVAEETMAYVRRDQPKEAYSFYQNFSRTAPIEERYKGAERLAKLRGLKKKWDPKGVFTKQLL